MAQDSTRSTGSGPSRWIRWATPLNHGEAVAALRRGGVGIVPTDTLYGIVGSALSRNAVRRIYRLRKRNPKKPMVILIGDVRDLKKFGVHLSPYMKKLLKQVWPGKVSVILPIAKKSALRKFRYLHRGTGTLAFRLPEPEWLRKLLRRTGPLVAPSANLEGRPPAKTIRAAKKYFGDGADFFVNAGQLDSKPSTLIKIKNGNVVVLRKGAVGIQP